MTSFLTDSLIIANPAISDIPKFSNIAGRAIYIIEHSDAGAIGVSLNQSFSTPIDKLAKELPALVNVDFDSLLSPKVLSGGPIAGDTPWILGKKMTQYDKQIANGVLAMNFSEQAFKDNLRERNSICGLGTFGWGAGQLEAELANSLWHYFPASEEALSAIPFPDSFRGAVQLLLAMKYD
ncbi:YqgE/AlgH family protein [Shewanella sp. AS16]|uniref:YqgE/AlgH family protein n=1 Tax=Shewanella sp. AS16 TaxID=2907625 RepID=UPI001F31F15F|nr:YqgE/AlgH family protein [Shewanella sp. AS16]MCE9688245.1 YqgE/AlgH family protein [Shewanella sp. AS16]